MVIPEFVRTVCTRFRQQPAAERLPLSASRDLPTKVLWGCAYSQAIARAKDACLSEWTLSSSAILEHAPAFRVDPTSLQHALLRSIPTFDALRSAIEDGLGRSRSPVLISGEDCVERDLVSLVCMQEISAWMGPGQKLGFLRARDLAGRSGLMWDEVLQIAVGDSPGDSVDAVRATLRAAMRSDFDSLGYVAVHDESVARELGVLIAGAHHAFVVADNDSLVDASLQAAGYQTPFATVPVCMHQRTITCHMRPVEVVGP